MFASLFSQVYTVKLYQTCEILHFKNVKITGPNSHLYWQLIRLDIVCLKAFDWLQFLSPGICCCLILIGYHYHHMSFSQHFKEPQSNLDVYHIHVYSENHKIRHLKAKYSRLYMIVQHVCTSNGPASVNAALVNKLLSGKVPSRLLVSTICKQY